MEPRFEPSRTGQPVPALQSYDRIIGGLMMAWDLPGAAVAVAKDGRLVYARGFGVADRDTGRPVQPDSLFRIASVSKPLTAVAALKLVEQGRLALDAPVWPLLQDLTPPENEEVDPRWREVTVRHLLHHAAGLDDTAAGDPFYEPARVAEALGVPSPVTATATCRYLLRQPLAAPPGEKHLYSNGGYCLLSQVIAAAAGEPYEQFVRQQILAPMGISDMHLGHTRLTERAPNEVHYYDDPGAEKVASVFPEQREFVPRPDGGFYLEALAGAGAWVGSAPDLVRLALHCDGRPAPADVLALASWQQMTARPVLPFALPDEPTWYGMGWLVRNTDEGVNCWHNGKLPGNTALLVSTGEGLTWAALFNRSGAELAELVDRKMWEAARAVTEWPTHDLFRSHP